MSLSSPSSPVVLSSSPSSKPIVWTIAASDSGGGAGVQADLKTLFDLGVHGCSVLTAVTAQNTKGVHHVEAITEDAVKKQLQALADDLPPSVIKIGVLPNVSILQCVMETIQQQPQAIVVLDTVIAPTQGQVFSQDNMAQALQSLLPYVDLVTPNIPEAEMLTGITITDTDAQQAAAAVLINKGAKGVLLKGGHVKSGHEGDTSQCQDYFLSATHDFWMTQQKQQTLHSHGTGCVLSSATAAFCAHGKSLHDAVVLANAYISKGLRFAHSHTPNDDQKGSVSQTGWPNNVKDFPQVSLSADAVNYVPMAACDTHALGLYPVVDSIDWLEKLLQLGVKTIQLRVKNIETERLDDMVKQAAALGREHQARLFINDYWQLAIKHNAYGVHLGQEDMADADIAAIRNAGLHLGISTHGEYEFAYAATFKPSY